MKKLMILTFLFAVVIGSANAVVSQASKDVVGNWKYEVPSAPYGYEKGTLVFSEKDGKLVGEVKFADGYKIDMKDVKMEEGGVLKCGLYVDYEYVSVKAKIEGTKMTGTVNTPEGEMKLTAEKQK
ncbi:MAG TPA: hypothetical protein VLQ91_22140 [Draconibacterium sp.]|nr:hypothetical protein [Draconibacterium sp.]